MSDAKDFVIENGVLKKYQGPGGDVVIPEGVTEIGYSAFGNCERLESVVIPEGVKSIGGLAFGYCQRLNRVELPASLVSVGLSSPWKGYAAFGDCISLREVIFAEGTTRISCDILYDQKALTTVVIPDSVRIVERYAFKGCKQLTNVTLGSALESVGGSAFENSGIKTLTITAANAVLEDIRLPEDAALIAENLPLANIQKEQKVNAVLGFARRYASGDPLPENYGKEYLKYIKSQRKRLFAAAGKSETLLAIMLGEKMVTMEDVPALLEACKTDELKQRVKQYQDENFTDKDAAKLAEAKEEKARSDSDLSKKIKNAGKLSDQKKVEMLHQVVIEGTLEELEALFTAAGTFEFTAGALALAMRYRGMDFVKALADHGASFGFDAADSTLIRKYKAVAVTKVSRYRTEYVLIPFLPHITPGQALDHSPLYGAGALPITDDLEQKVLPLAQRLNILKHLMTLPEVRVTVSVDDILFWALIQGDLETADGLMELGADMNQQSPQYYGDVWNGKWHGVNCPTYMEQFAAGKANAYWNEALWRLGGMESQKLLAVFERLIKLADKAGMRVSVSKYMFEQFNWNGPTIDLAVARMDISRLDKKRVAEEAVRVNGVGALEAMVNAGVITTPKYRDELIELASKEKQIEVLAWLMDYKNKTADLAAEETANEKKLMKELTEDPNSVSAMKRNWGFKKNEDGTLCITSYKGTDTEVVIPSKIGKDTVTAIAKTTFDPNAPRVTSEQKRARAAITSLTVPGTIRVIPKGFASCAYDFSLDKYPCALPKLKTLRLCEGVEEIGGEAFRACTELSEVILPDSLTCIGSNDKYSLTDGAFRSCTNLRHITLPAGLKTLATCSFLNCRGLEEVEIPGSVESIGSSAFAGCSGLKKVVIHKGVRKIEDGAFERCEELTELTLPGILQKVGRGAFSGCTRMKEVKLSGPSFFAVKDGIYICRKEELMTVAGDPEKLIVPEGITTLGECALAYHKATKEIVLPKGVTQLGEDSVRECEVLTSITLPDGLKTIGKRAFSGSYRLKEITIPASVEDIAPDAFDRDFDGKYNITFHVSAGSYAESYAARRNIPFIAE